MTTTNLPTTPDSTLRVAAVAVLCAGLSCGALLSAIPASAQAAAFISDQILMQAQEMLAEDQVQQAEQLLQDGVDEDPRATPVLNELAMAQVRAGELEEARATLERALDTAPVYARIYRNLMSVNQALAMDAYRHSLDLPSARGQLPELVAIAPGSSPVPLAVVAPAPEVAPADTASVETLLPEEEPEAFVRRWAAAWARQDVPAYLEAYAPGYTDARARSHAAWREFRSERLMAPGFIEISLEDVEVRHQDGVSAVVEFDQRYRSDTFGDRTRKLLVLNASESGWQIQREYSVQ